MFKNDANPFLSKRIFQNSVRRVPWIALVENIFRVETIHGKYHEVGEKAGNRLNHTHLQVWNHNQTKAEQCKIELKLIIIRILVSEKRLDLITLNRSVRRRWCCAVLDA